MKENDYKTIVGKVRAKGLMRGGKTRLEVILGDGTGDIQLLWFAGWRFLEKQFKKGYTSSNNHSSENRGKKLGFEEE